VVLLALLFFALDLPVQGKSLIGLSLNLPEGGTAADLDKIARQERQDGANLMYLSGKWSDLEPRPGQYNLNCLGSVEHIGALGFKILFTIQTLDTNHRSLPSDLMSQPFDSPLVRNRFDALLKVIATRLGPDIRWVSLGNEVDVYLSQHESELEPYAKFVEHARDVLHSQHPQLAVGVTTTHDGARYHPGIAARLNRSMDVVGMTYYPIGADWRARPIASLDSDFARMIQTAGTKPLLLQEFGCPADPGISSDDLQAFYVDGLFRQLKKYGDRVAGANWFLYCDFNHALVDKLMGYYMEGQNGVAQDQAIRFRDYLSSLGLKRADGTARKSWEVFVSRTRAWSLR
jgi:hypothetical protein